MRRRTKALIATAATVVVLGALGAGAYALIDTVNSSFRIGPGVAAPAAMKTITPTPTPTFKVGDTVPESARDSLPDGYTLYQMSNGSYVVVSATQPLPAPVQAHIQARVAAAPSANVHDGETSTRSISAQRALAGTLSLQTGRNVVVIMPSYGSAGINDPIGVFWGSVGDGIPSYTPFAAKTEAEVQAHVQSFIAQSGQSADDFLVLVKQQ